MALCADSLWGGIAVGRSGGAHAGFELLGNAFCGLCQPAHHLGDLARCSDFVEPQLDAGIDELFVGHLIEVGRASNGRCELFMGPHRITIGVNPCVLDRCAQEVVERCHALPLLVHQERNVLQVRVRVSNQSVEEDPAVHRHARYRPVTALADEILELG